MLISGLYKFSTVNYPSKFSCVLFLKGCACNCDYCYNKQLLYSDCIDEKEVRDFLESRVGLLDAIVFSGGEPMYQINDLLPWCQYVKSLGFLVGLHTTGYNCNNPKFGEIIKLCDWVGLDFKAPSYKYVQVCGRDFDIFENSLPLVRAVPSYEIRTTLNDKLTKEDLLVMRKYLDDNGVGTWYLQRQLKDGSFCTSPFKLDIPNTKVR